MKAVYCLWMDFDCIDKLVEAGINTLMITAHDLPWERESGYYDSKKKAIDTILRYKNKCKIFLVPLWVRDPNFYSVKTICQWKDESGEYLSRTPCPTSKLYAESRILPAIDFCKEYNLDGLIWDLEHLMPEKYKREIIPFYRDNLFSPKYRCNCITCSNYSTENLWKVHANLISSILSQSRIPIHGQLPYSAGWTMRQFPGDLHHFTEETYKKDIGIWEWLRWEFSWWRAKVSPKVIPGIWCDFHYTEERLINYIKKIYHKYGSFWFYSHVFLNEIPNPHLDYTLRGPASDWFFEELRKI